MTVRDSVTNIPAGHGATVTVHDGSYSDSLRLVGYPSDSLGFQGATERPGTYTIDVQKAGYLPWSRVGVVVRAGSCHVIPVSVEVRVQPL